MLKKLFGIFKKREEEGEEKKRKKFIKWLIIGIVIVVIIIVVVLVFVLPKFSKSSPNSSPAKLKVTIITKQDCPECWDTALFTDALAQYNVKISTTTVFYDSAKGKDLVSKYKIEKVPTLLITGDLNKDPNLAPFWKALGEIQGDTFIFKQVIPPYIDVASGKLKGQIKITYLTDNSCKTCYDVMLHATALRNLAMPINNYKVIDVSSADGKALVSKYNIKAVPTVLISGEVSEYANLGSLWSQVGVVAKDGTYVFTQVDLMGTYKNLSNNKIVTPPPATTTAATPVVK